MRDLLEEKEKEAPVRTGSALSPFQICLSLLDAPIGILILVGLALSWPARTGRWLYGAVSFAYSVPCQATAKTYKTAILL